MIRDLIIAGVLAAAPLTALARWAWRRRQAKRDPLGFHKAMRHAKRRGAVLFLVRVEPPPKPDELH